MKYLKPIGLIVVVIGLLGGFFYWSLMRMIPPSMDDQAAAPTVKVAVPIIQDVVNYDEFSGNLASMESVDIRARVEGYLRRAAFDDGAFVRKGELLFEIEPDTYRTERDRARASLQSARADLERAERDYERARQAAQSDAVSQQEVTRYKAQRDMADASVLAAQAALDQAELNLSYTTIHAPLDGRISRRYVDPGNLVGAGENTLLANVVALDPIYVYFHASESEYLDYTRDVRRQMALEPNELPVSIRLANEEAYAHPGRLDYIDNQVDPETGTLQIRGRLPNPDHKLYPGMFVRLRIPAQTIADAVLVREAAIGSDIGGKYLLVVDADNTVRQRPVVLGRQKDSLRVIESGLAAGETYIVAGLQFVNPGQKVTPVTDEADAKTPSPESTETPAAADSRS